MKFYLPLLMLLSLMAGSSARQLRQKDGGLDRKLASRFLYAHPTSTTIPEEYIVRVEVGKEDQVETLINDLREEYPNAKVLHRYHDAFSGFAIQGVPEAAMMELLQKHHHTISLIEEDIVVHKDVTWGLDRIDESDLPLDGAYAPSSGVDGTGVDIYIIDTGVRTSHNEFSGRISEGVDCTGGNGVCNPGQGTGDVDGHGTHVAGTAAGSTWGVAKGARIIPVKVLGDDGSGSGADVIAGIDYVASQHLALANKKSVANMSLGGGFFQAENDAVREAVEAGVVMVVAAGNENQDACNTSPASEPSAITVGSTTAQDQRSSFSNTGDCVDIFAPGSDITSAGNGNDSAAATFSGTSMASPHVAGAAALLLQANPPNGAAEVSTQLVNMGSKGKISGNLSGSPNVLLYVGGITFPGGPNPTPNPPTPTPPAPTPTPPAPVPTPPTPAPVPDNGCIDTPNFSDIYGDGCDYYEENDWECQNCLNYENWFGINPCDACCRCGGGSSTPTTPAPVPTPPTPPPAPVTPAPVPTPPTPPPAPTTPAPVPTPPTPPPAPVPDDSCTDTPNFVDYYGDGCDYYYDNPYDCPYCVYYANSDGINPCDACCECGGGSLSGGGGGSGPSCTDSPGFLDIDGLGCDFYEAFFYSECDKCSDYANEDGVDACDACCACDGGSS